MNIIEQLLAQTTDNEVREFINKQINARLEGKNPNYPIPSQTEVEHVVDYLNNAAQMTKLKLRRASYEAVVEQSHLWIERLSKQAAGIVETEQDIEVVKEWDTGFKLVKLVGKAAFQREGKLMSHCVGSYVAKTDTEILSLRDPSNNPHCTIEITNKGNNLQQIKGKGNGCIHPKYIRYVLDILKEFQGTVRDNELNNLGYMPLDEDVWKLYDFAYKDLKYMTFNNKRFFYKNQKLTLRRNEDTVLEFIKELA